MDDLRYEFRKVVWIISLILFAFPFFLLSFTIHAPKPTFRHQATARLNGYEFQLEIAGTPSARSRGLSGRGALADGTGMLFLFDQPAVQSFWMKGMLFPLDFIWLRGETIVDLTQNVMPPSPGTPDSLLPRIIPSEPVDRVIEVNAGTISRFKFEPGQAVQILLP